ncbi:hypothetical protein [Candidatus Cardinium hertigii]|uniref:Uncharacterized protein n=1 Tax=Candidatus Cardinium hertigii TaxID=247481 RepID=A0A2Z3L8E3_9BACT|nr:hypothetical protein [Candidatus Cardinium hertigii]AWN81863.1 hypothetical protein DK880_00544 [Candidatus Cardinium hertigii]
MTILLFVFYIGRRFVGERLLWIGRVIPLCFGGLLGLSASCSKPEEACEHAPHPIWCYFNNSEDNIPKDKCLITKLGDKVIRFHITAGQSYLNPGSALTHKVNTDNIVEIKLSDTTQENRDDEKNLIIMPHAYGYVTEKDFSNTMRAGITYNFNKKEKNLGLPAVFLQDLEKQGCKDAVVIIGTGFQRMLGVSEELEKKLKEKESKGELTCFIHSSYYAVEEHNTATKAGKKVFTFIHLGP